MKLLLISLLILSGCVGRSPERVKEELVNSTESPDECFLNGGNEYRFDGYTDRGTCVYKK